MTTPLLTIAPLLRYNLADDGFGNLVPVPGAAWGAAYYNVYGLYKSDYPPEHVLRAATGNERNHIASGWRRRR